VFARPLLVPYLFTTGPATAPTIGLLFTEPQRVPGLTLNAALAPNVDLPVGYRQSRSPAGATLDGVLLRARDPRHAVATLVAAGASLVTDEVSWFADHRAVLTDAADRAEAVATDRKVAATDRGAVLAGWGAFGMAVLGGVVGDAALPWVLAAAGTLFVVHVLLRRRVRRALQRSVERGT
jgi:hypothetical protein